MCLPPQLLSNQFKLPVTYHLRNTKTWKIKGNVVTMMICHIFEPISFFYYVVITIANFSYIRGPLFFVQWIVALSSTFFQTTIKFVVQVKKRYVAFEDPMKFPFAKLSPKFFKGEGM
jgi:hypothetical protein